MCSLPYLTPLSKFLPPFNLPREVLDVCTACTTTEDRRNYCIYLYMSIRSSKHPIWLNCWVVGETFCVTYRDICSRSSCGSGGQMVVLAWGVTANFHVFTELAFGQDRLVHSGPVDAGCSGNWSCHWRRGWVNARWRGGRSWKRSICTNMNQKEAQLSTLWIKLSLLNKNPRL